MTGIKSLRRKVLQAVNNYIRHGCAAPPITIEGCLINERGDMEITIKGTGSWHHFKISREERAQLDIKDIQRRYRQGGLPT